MLMLIRPDSSWPTAGAHLAQVAISPWVRQTTHAWRRLSVRRRQQTGHGAVLTIASSRSPASGTKHARRARHPSVDPHRPVPVGQRALRAPTARSRRRPDAGVVERHVHVAKAIKELVGELLHGIGRGDVGHDRERLDAALLDLPLGRRRAPVISASTTSSPRRRSAAPWPTRSARHASHDSDAPGGPCVSHLRRTPQQRYTVAVRGPLPRVTSRRPSAGSPP